MAILVRHTQITITLLVSLVLLGACAEISSPNDSVLSGVVQLARVSGATIKVFAFEENQKGALLAQTVSDSNGEYTVNLGSYKGYVIVESTGGEYIEEADMGSPNPPISKASDMYAFLKASAASNAPITPMTTLVKDRLESLVGEGSSVETAKEQALTEVSKIFGVEKEDIEVLPVAPPASSLSNQLITDERAVRSALALAAFSYVLKDFKQTNVSASPRSFMSALVEDLKYDGKLDGKGKQGASNSITKQLAVQWKDSLQAAKAKAAIDPALVFKVNVTSEVLTEASRISVNMGSNFNGFNESDGKWYLNGVDMELDGNGFGSFLGKVYFGGEVANGPESDGKFYQNGILAEGSVGGKIYESGLLFRGYLPSSGKLYLNGELFSGKADSSLGDYNGAYYVNGDLAFGVHEKKCYRYGFSDGNLDENGTGLCPLVGTIMLGYYYNGVIANGTFNNVTYENGLEVQGEYNNKHYYNGILLNGVFNNLCYKNGLITEDLENGTGLCSGDNKYYVNGSGGYGVLNKVCYFNGEPNNFLDENGTGMCGVGYWSNFLAFENGVLRNGVVNNICYKNGVATQDLVGGTGFCTGDNRYYLEGVHESFSGVINKVCVINGELATYENTLDENGTGMCGDGYWSNLKFFLKGEAILRGAFHRSSNTITVYADRFGSSEAGVYDFTGLSSEVISQLNSFNWIFPQNATVIGLSLNQ